MEMKAAAAADSLDTIASKMSNIILKQVSESFPEIIKIS